MIENVLSVFDGISAGRVALDRAGITYQNYYASEIDKYAIQIAQKNYSDTIQLGDIRTVTKESTPSIQLLIGGSPCTSLSAAGLKEGFDGESGLFFEYVRLLNKLKPQYFLLENVKMKKEWRDVISKELGVEPILINSSLVSAQNRPRYYWTNIPGVELPVDKGIQLRDIIEQDVDAKYYLTPKNVAHYQRQFGSKGKYADLDGKSQTLTAAMGMGGGNIPVVLTERRTEEAKQIRREYQKLGRDFSPRRAKELVAREDGKSNALTTHLTREHIVVIDELWRKLTPRECSRLQTLPDGYTEGISDTQQYKLIGNGWTVDVIAHIFSYMEKTNV